jgi:secreted trypsin-like serine protease
VKTHYIVLMSLLLSCYQITSANIIPQARIINGNIASEAQMPWQVALVTNPLDAYQSYVCSGSLIADRWVVTAAHCTEQLKNLNKDYSVLVGTSNLQDNQQGQIIKVKQAYIHEQYNKLNYDNDIALLELENTVDFIKCGTHCQTLDLINPLIEKQNAPIDSPVQIAGWGVLEDCENSQSEICQQYSGQMLRNPQLYPTTLRYTTLKLSHCVSSQSAYKQEQITENMFCAESPVQDQPVDTCFGDSGAGLTIRNGLDKPYLLGIASWGVGCAKQGYAGVYTRVANYTDWIDSYISPQKVVEINDQKNNKNIGGGSVNIMMILMLMGLAFMRWFSARD